MKKSLIALTVLAASGAAMAIAAPEAASTVRAIRDFFIARFSKVKQRAPVRGFAPMRGIQMIPPVPRANLLLGSCWYCTRGRTVSQRN